MNSKTIVRATFATVLLGASASMQAMADEQQPAETAYPKSLTSGGYVAPMLNYVIADQSDSDLDNGLGGTFSVGIRRGMLAYELGYVYAKLGDTTQDGVNFNVLVFPLQSLPGLYGSVGFGALVYDGYPTVQPYKNPHFINGSAGAGYFIPVRVGDYDFAIRAEGRYRISRRLRHQDSSDIDIDMPRRFNDGLISVGLQLPLSKTPPPPPPPTPVAVVAPQPPPDSDGDGVPDDADKCPGTPAGTKVDSTGCPIPTCKTPAAGEQVSLNGCGVGDVIVLSGVNFEFNKARLTANAQTILDNVASELAAHSAITVEVRGHTDALGSDAYNQRLSEARAKSVTTYLTKHGVDASRMSAVGLGEAEPVDTNETEEGREHNRRVELKVTSAPEAAPAASAPASGELAPAPSSEVKTAEAVPGAAGSTAADATTGPAPTEAPPADPAGGADPATSGAEVPPMQP